MSIAELIANAEELAALLKRLGEIPKQLTELGRSREKAGYQIVADAFFSSAEAISEALLANGTNGEPNAETPARELQLGTWTKQSLNAGGTLTLKSLFPGKAYFKARMEWPSEDPVAGEICTRAEDALESLEKALADDAAREMQEKGAV